MTNELKSALRIALFCIALLLTVVSCLFVHGQNGSAFIGSIPRYMWPVIWQYVSFSQNVIQLVVIWSVYLILHFTVLRRTSPRRTTTSLPSD